ncbi:MAG TPA: NADH-quinone oxidoreductase subunit C [Sedimentisphaerales bacterium]|jgi:Ni,Fe-hydrogenase III large subunit|nr:NADH-quinone oxidoreductase subunit C [Sedimentisphaerales bacterium]HNU29634.1 NADH-quinone oxidoreductase subunit C [Sedimentisphaerales bacterium]
MTTLPQIHNGQAIPWKNVPELAVSEWRAAVLERVHKGRRISALFGVPDDKQVVLVAVLTNDQQATLELCRTSVGDTYPSLTTDAPQAHWFEREIAEQWGIVPEGHPWLKPIRFHPSYTGRDAWGRDRSQPIEPCVTDYFRVEGEEVHEVAVGPVHAGIIEPGHFRFQCHGENVFHLEIELGYQHRGIERALVRSVPVRAYPQSEGDNASRRHYEPRTPHLAETLAGDTTIGHVTAYASILESLGGTMPPPRARSIRAIALELERLANHTGDLGALANDVGFLPTASYCGRLRGDFLNMTALLCGNRFGRNLVRPGGVRFDLPQETANELLDRLRRTFDDTRNAVNLLWETPSVMSRFDGTGSVCRQDASRLGLVGPAARASGVNLDVRSDLPWGGYQLHPLPSVTWHTGDVAARAYVRWFEIEKSVEFITDEVKALPSGPVAQDVAPPAGEHLAVALVEGWRGEICHVALTDERGRLKHYKIVDPSFHNWFGLAMALRDQPISDFPLCNKSFNLSYCGHDL